MKILMSVFTALSLLTSLNVKADDSDDRIARAIIGGIVREVIRDGRDAGPGYYDHGNHGQYPGGGNHYYPPQNYGRAQLYSSPLTCYGGNKGFCSTYISWSVDQYYGTNAQAVVTVSIPTSQVYSERYENVFACGARGQQLANWIRPNDTYIFRIYNTYDCRSIPYNQRPLSEIVVRR